MHASGVTARTTNLDTDRLWSRISRRIGNAENQLPRVPYVAIKKRVHEPLVDNGDPTRGHHGQVCPLDLKCPEEVST